MDEKKTAHARATEGGNSCCSSGKCQRSAATIEVAGPMPMTGANAANAAKATTPAATVATSAAPGDVKAKKGCCASASCEEDKREAKVPSESCCGDDAYCSARGPGSPALEGNCADGRDWDMGDDAEVQLLADYRSGSTGGSDGDGGVGVSVSAIELGGLCCKKEASHVRNDFLPVAGVRSIFIEMSTKEMVVQHDTSLISCDSIVDLLNLRYLKARAVRDGGLRSVGPGAHTADRDRNRGALSVLSVEGMCCASEACIIVTVLGGLEGVHAVRPNVVMRNVTVVHVPALISSAKLAALLNQKHLHAKVVRDGGAPPKPPMSGRGQAAGTTGADGTAGAGVEADAGGGVEGARSASLASGWPRWNVLLSLAMWLLSLLHFIEEPEFMDEFRYVALGSIALCLPSVLRKAWGRLRARVLDINVLMSIAVVGAIALGDYSEGAAVVTLFSLSDWLEARATARVRVAINALFNLAPETAVLAFDVGGVGREGDACDVAAVPVGAQLIVKAGEKFPLDGVIADGFASTYADESPLTGESLPVKKRPGDPVAAGTVNVGDYVQMVTTALHEDSTVARLIRLIEEANLARAPTQQLIERVANVYTPIVVLTALTLATVPWAWGNDVGREYFKTALVLLVVACPCALVISTPITYVCGLAYAARRGILVKGGRYLEGLAHLQVLALDKTGTLTQGDFNLQHWETVTARAGRSGGIEEASCEPAGNSLPLPSAALVAQLVRLAEDGSAHPIAVALALAPQFLSAQEAHREALVGSGEEARDAHEEARADAGGWRVAAVRALPGRGLHATLEHLGEPPSLDLFVGNERLARERGWFARGVNAKVEAVGDADGEGDGDGGGDGDVDAVRVRAWEAAGLTAGWVGSEQHGPLAVYAVGDALRPEAAEATAQLRALGLRLVMLTGDNAGAAASVAARVGIAREAVYAQLLPEEKVAALRAEQRRAEPEDEGEAQVGEIAESDGIGGGSGDIDVESGRWPLKRTLTRKAPVKVKVGMIGDGVNDAPSLATADVSLAMGCIGSAVALETADVALMNDDLLMVPKAVRLGRLCTRKIKQNVVFSIVSKMVVLAITLTVFPSLWLAIIVDVGGMLAVTLNSMAVLGRPVRSKTAATKPDAP